MPNVVGVDQSKMFCEHILLDSPAAKVMHVAPELPSAERLRSIENFTSLGSLPSHSNLIAGVVIKGDKFGAAVRFVGAAIRSAWFSRLRRLTGSGSRPC